MHGNVDQFAVITAQPGIEMRSTITSWVALTKPGSDWIGPDRTGQDHGLDHGSDHRSDHGSDHRSDHGSDHGSNSFVLKKELFYSIQGEQSGLIRSDFCTCPIQRPGH